MIDQIGTITRLGEVPVPHTNRAVYAVSKDGRRWVAKRETEMGFEALLAEALTWQIGQALGVRLPSAAFCAPQRTWLSALIPDVAHWNWRFADMVRNPDEVGAMLVLDLWMHNEARHGRNVLAQGVGDGVRVWAIDGDEALVGHIDDYAARVGTAPSVHNHARGLPISKARRGAEAAVEAAHAVRAEVLRQAVDSACSIARESRSEELYLLVAQQRDALNDLVIGYLDAVENLR